MPIAVRLGDVVVETAAPADSLAVLVLALGRLADCDCFRAASRRLMLSSARTIPA